MHILVRLSSLKHRCEFVISRSCFSWPRPRRVFDAEFRKSIETKYRAQILSPPPRNAASVSARSDDKFYLLSMFPYPSGTLHMGHVRVYALSDCLYRYKRMCLPPGSTIIHPMGWDSFGLPAENAARDHGVEPRQWTEDNIARMKAQMKDLCLAFNWEREIMTHKPDYYKWTQWLFCSLFKSHFAYKRLAPVNWDPVDQTVLANEQIDSEGHSWRSGAKVEQKFLSQWFVRSTAFSKTLYEEMPRGELGWDSIGNIQRAWIGVPEGVNVEFRLKSRSTQNPENDDPCHDFLNRDHMLSVHTRFPQLIHGLSHILIHPSNPVLHFDNTTPEEYTTLTRIAAFDAVHPLTNDAVPVFVAPHHVFRKIPNTLDDQTVLGQLCFPDIDPEARRFAHSKDIKYTSVLTSHTPTTFDIREDGCTGRYLPPGAILTASGPELSGLIARDAFEPSLILLQKHRAGGYPCSAGACDWLVSRQRAWGTPIPAVICPSCRHVEVLPKSRLPVTHEEKARGPPTNKSLWTMTSSEDQPLLCNRCSTPMQWDMDTLDTFFDSSWYYLRFLDPFDAENLVRPDIADKNMPVDLYIGGLEHATTHFYLSRFITRYLYCGEGSSLLHHHHNNGNHHEDSHGVKAMGDTCLVSTTPEPFKNFLSVGLVKGHTFQDSTTGEYLAPEKAALLDADKVVRTVQKMSKSKFNGVDPKDLVREHGFDLVKSALLDSNNASPWTGVVWSDQLIKRSQSAQTKMFNLMEDWSYYFSGHQVPPNTPDDFEINTPVSSEAYRNLRNELVRSVTAVMERYATNGAFLVIYSTVNSLRKTTPPLTTVQPTAYDAFEKAVQQRYRDPELVGCLATLIVTLYPFSPCLATEFWNVFREAIRNYPGDVSSFNEALRGLDLSLDVSQQSWPKLDATHQLPLIVVLNDQIEFSLGIDADKLDDLTESDAEQLASQSPFFQVEDFNDRIHSCTLQIVPSHSGIVTIKTTNYVREKKAAAKVRLETSFETDHAIEIEEATTSPAPPLKKKKRFRKRKSKAEKEAAQAIKVNE